MALIEIKVSEDSLKAKLALCKVLFSNISFENGIHKTLEDKTKLVGAHELTQLYSINNKTNSPFILLRSGGTTSVPKFIKHSLEYNDFVIKNGVMAIREHILSNDVAMNLLCPAGLCGGYYFVERVLEKIGCSYLGYGSNINVHELEFVIKSAGVNCIIASPSTIINLLETIDFKLVGIKKVFYLGEMLPDSVYMKLSKNNIIVTAFVYANTEMGPIGYQCKKCRNNHYHIFDEFFHYSILVEGSESLGELCITPLHKHGLGLITYKTGDLVRLVEHSCDINTPVFEFLGRTDASISIKSNLFFQSFIMKIINRHIIVDQSYVQVYYKINPLFMDIWIDTIDSLSMALIDNLIEDFCNTFEFSDAGYNHSNISVKKVNYKDFMLTELSKKRFFVEMR